MSPNTFPPEQVLCLGSRVYLCGEAGCHGGSWSGPLLKAWSTPTGGGGCLVFCFCAQMSDAHLYLARHKAAQQQIQKKKL